MAYTIYKPTTAVRGVLFDMDGTLLDSLSDMHDAVNHILAENGWAARSREEIRAFVGNGARKLMERAIPETLAPQRFETVLADYKDWYQAHNCVKTQPYPGISHVLAELEARGVKTAVVSNKPDATTKTLAARFFPGLPAFGQRDDVPPKPSPDLVFRALDTLGVAAADAVYVGDSEVDVATARNAGLPLAAVSWGFRGRQALAQAGAETIVDTAEQLLQVLL